MFSISILPLVIFQWMLVFFKFSVSDDLSESIVASIEVAYIEITPITNRDHDGRTYIVKNVQDPLNLTCSVFDNSTVKPKYKISWSFPYSSHDRSKPDLYSSVSPSRISLSFLIPSVEMNDEGEYGCTAFREGSNEEPLGTYISVTVKHPPFYKGKCGDNQFGCIFSKPPTCIHQRYKCDGHEDCQEGEDEALTLCGRYPCNDKLPCKEISLLVERCIPKSWCCDMKLDANCTTKVPLSCCPLRVPEDRYYYSKHDTEMAFLETTIYTVIGCAMVFMIAVTVLAIAICRVHMKRSYLSRCPVDGVHRRQTPPEMQGQMELAYPNPRAPLCEFDVCLGRGCTIDNLLVSYDIDRGVQLTGHTVHPPPYSKVLAVPPREGPPPPYSSQERLDVPEGQELLQSPTKETAGRRAHCMDPRPAARLRAHGEPWALCRLQFTSLLH